MGPNQNYKLLHSKKKKQKNTINKMKRQPIKWEKILANDVTNKDLVCKIYKQIIQLNINKTKQPNQNIGKRPKQAFLQRRHTDR